MKKLRLIWKLLKSNYFIVVTQSDFGSPVDVESKMYSYDIRKAIRQIQDQEEAEEAVESVKTFLTYLK
jgi:hypothetical protein